MRNSGFAGATAGHGSYNAPNTAVTTRRTRQGTDTAGTHGMDGMMMKTEKGTFLAARLDELVSDLEADAPSGPPQVAPGAPEGPLVVAQRHRAEVDTADDQRLDEIMHAHPDIARSWSSR